METLSWKWESSEFLYEKQTWNISCYAIQPTNILSIAVDV